MQSRRNFIKQSLALLPLIGLSDWQSAIADTDNFKGKQLFSQILSKAQESKWSTLPIGDLMGKVATEFLGTPYVASTLELSADREIVSVDLLGMDCATFYETTLAFARMIKKNGKTSDDLLNEVAFIRYRAGKPGDYSTRLHYASDWFADNASKGVIKILADLPNSQRFTKTIDFMSTHPESYRQLKAHPELIPKIKVVEAAMNKRELTFVPLDKLAGIESLLKTGDIVAVCTNRPGLDVAHTGLVWVDEKGVAHFMDATSRKSVMKVVIEPGHLSAHFNGANNLYGVMFARPLEL